MKQRTKDKFAVAGGVLFILLFVAAIVGSIWLHLFAPCEYVGWLPTKDVPNRCMEVKIR